jgi:hypothetical protein
MRTPEMDPGKKKNTVLPGCRQRRLTLPLAVWSLVVSVGGDILPLACIRHSNELLCVVQFLGITQSQFIL